MIVYLNGAYVDAAEAKISVFDGGYLYGDGLFETIRLYSGKPFDLDGHLSRLKRELELLGFEWVVETEKVNDILRELASRNGLADQDSQGRLTISRGYREGDLMPLVESQAISPTIFLAVQSLPAEIETWQSEGIHVQVMKSAFARGNFPQLKTLNYLPSLMALRFAVANECHEALLIDRQGKVLEGAISNVFIIKNERLMTPPARLGILPGRTRSFVLDICRSLGYACEEVAFDRRDLVTATEVFVTSTVREVLPVTRIDGSKVGDGIPGSITQAIQEKFRQAVHDTLAEYFA